MKKTVLKISILLVGILLAIPSCDDNGRSLGDIYISIATVIPEGENAYSFLLDNDKRLWPAAGNVRYAPTHNQRVFLNYTILWESSGATYDYDIKVNDIWNILTKQAIELNAENQDSIGNDPVKVKDIWVGGDYLNVSFLFNYGGVRPHLINLVENTLSDETSSDAIDLEFRHNAYQSPQTKLYEGFVCFDLKPFRTDDADSVNLSIKVKGWNGETTTYDVVYRYNQPVAEEKTTARIPTPVISSNEYY
ncbi:NigD-like protein [Proteiniphilum acetatigenes]|uniref:NigD-like protein n=1 Tax=Proteiniphilum acetatigenes TaxID=294710 RepID=UPI000372B744|nr:NigD-like protein [Proteiniphilum acetatigenes]SFK86427.1 NigD-like protein [Porphyromonadaceae bacterium KH3CP3RA]